MLLSYAKQCKSVLDAGLGKLASSHRLRVRGVMDSLNGAGSIITYDLMNNSLKKCSGMIHLNLKLWTDCALF